MTGVLPTLPGWRLIAHVDPQPLRADWHAALVARLGQRPRRIGPWAELALYGALQCLDQAREARLAPAARLRVLSLGGARSATRAGIGQVRAGRLPLPFQFMQSQPSLMLAALAQALDWRGDASFMAGRMGPAIVQAALHGARPEGGLLLGMVEEEHAAPPRSAWWRWVAD